MHVHGNVVRHASWLVAISQHIRVNGVEVRSDFSHRQRAGGSVATQNVNIVADETNRADSGAMAISAAALEFDAD